VSPEQALEAAKARFPSWSDFGVVILEWAAEKRRKGKRDLLNP
jgi:hypothetical protein